IVQCPGSTGSSTSTRPPEIETLKRTSNRSAAISVKPRNAGLRRCARAGAAAPPTMASSTAASATIRARLERRARRATCACHACRARSSVRIALGRGTRLLDDDLVVRAQARVLGRVALLAARERERLAHARGDLVERRQAARRALRQAHDVQTEVRLVRAGPGAGLGGREDGIRQLAAEQHLDLL